MSNQAGAPRLSPAVLGLWTARLAGRLLVGLIVVYLVAPLAAVVYVSFSPVGFFQFPPSGFSLRWFENLWHTPSLLDALVRSLWTASVVVVTTAVLATAAALALDRTRFRGRGALDLFFLSPLVVPELVFALALLDVYSSLSLRDTYLGLILAHLVIAFPYFVRSVYVSLAARDPSLEAAAESLGASPLRVFRTITLPSIRGGVLSGGVFAFIVSFDQFTVSLFVVGSSTETLPVAIYNYLFDNADPTVAAVSTVVIAIGLVAALAANRIVGLDRVLVSERPSTGGGPGSKGR